MSAMKITEPMIVQLRKIHYSNGSTSGNPREPSGNHGKKSHLNMIERMRKAGLLHYGSDRSPVMTETGRAVLEKRDADFKFWRLDIGLEESEFKGETPDPIGNRFWVCDSVPMSSDGPIKKKAWLSGARIKSYGSTLGNCLNSAKNPLYKHGFNDNLIVVNISDELREMAELQAAHRDNEKQAFEVTKRKEWVFDAGHPFLKRLDQLDVSSRTHALFKRLGLVIVADLRGVAQADLLSQRNFGRKSLYELQEAIAGLNDRSYPDDHIHLGMTIEPWKLEKVKELFPENNPKKTPKLQLK